MDKYVQWNKYRTIKKENIYIPIWACFQNILLNENNKQRCKTYKKMPFVKVMELRNYIYVCHRSKKNINKIVIIKYVKLDGW
jgi:CRISPR/Cas system CSM-associated protein Csm4 (group 5 of RAMP superfamily)